MMDIKHKKEIIAWANGKQIQIQIDEWEDTDKPLFTSSNSYRVKPELPLIDGEFYKILYDENAFVMEYNYSYNSFLGVHSRLVNSNDIKIVCRMQEFNE